MWYNGISDQKSLFSWGCFKAVHSPAKHRRFSGSQFPQQLSEEIGLNDLSKDPTGSAILQKFNEHS